MGRHRCEHYTAELVENAEWLLDEVLQERRARGVTTQQVVARLADKIRALHAEGVGTTQIRQLLADLGLRISHLDIRKVVADDGAPTEPREDGR